MTNSSSESPLALTNNQLGIEGSIGNTPLVKLDKLFGSNYNIYAKLEIANPGGSMKDRPGFGMVKNALKERLVKPGGVIVESSSGNMGIGIAQACKAYGIRFICVVDAHTNLQNIKLIESLGASTIKVTKKGEYGDLLAARLAKVQEVIAKTPGCYWTNQYENKANPLSYHAMMKEIDVSLDGKVDTVFCATGTCGTIRGCWDYTKSVGLKTKFYAVDAKGSAVFGDHPKPRLLPGHGSTRKSQFFFSDMAYKVQHISDQEAINGCYLLLETEAILAGGSSGAIISALKKELPSIVPQSNIVIILGDRGERYIDTIYNRSWLKKNNISIG